MGRNWRSVPTIIAAILTGCTTEVVLKPCEGELDLEITQPRPGASLVEGATSQMDVAVALTCDSDTLAEADRVVSSDLDGVVASEGSYAAGYYTFELPPLSRGEHTLSVTVAAAGANGTASVDLTVLENVPPTVVIEQPTPDTILDAGPVEIVAQVADDEPLETLGLTWAIDGATVSGPTSPLPDGSALLETTLAFGCHEIQVTVTDLLGQQGRATQTMLVLAEGADLSDYTWLIDADGDGWGDAEAVQLACDQPEGTVPVTEQTDCDDSDGEARPGAADYCRDGVDSDCNPLTPENCSPNGEISSLAATYTAPASHEVRGGYDLNQDGRDDLVLGVGEALELFYTGTSIGALQSAEVIQSYPNPRSNQRVLPGEAGHAVTIAPDFTGDGLPDLIAGNPVARTACQFTSARQWYHDFGRVALISSGDFVTGILNGGDAMSADPLMQPYPMKDTGPLQAGQAFILNVDSDLGGRTIGCPDGVRNNVGDAVHAVGDLDGDGLSEILTSASRLDAYNEGAVWLIMSSDVAASTDAATTDLPTLARLTLEGVDGEKLGTALGSADVDGDGLDDLLIGGGGAGTPGKLYVVYGRDIPVGQSTLPVSALASVTFTGTGDEDALGTQVAGMGDLDGDGDEEFAVSAPGAASGAGVVYLVPGFYEVSATHDIEDTFTTAVTPNATAAVRIVGDLEDGLEHVERVGDVNGDGVEDLVLGAPQSSQLGEGSGTAYLLYAGTPHWGDLWDTGTGAPRADLLVGDITQTTSGARFGSSIVGDAFGQAISTAGDMNQDGYDDIVISSASGTYVFVGGGT